jgi:hypothetical protein
VPGLGATGGSKFQLSVGWRQARATQSYNGFYVNRNFSHNWQPYERMSIMDVSARYIVNSRVSVSVTLPIVDNNFSMLYPPNGPGQGVRSGVNAIGIGDITVFGQSYLLKPIDHPFGNVALGLGLKIPSGNWNLQGDLPNLTGTGFMQRAIYPPAIMPGDGGTGIIFGINGFKQFRRSIWRGQTVFGSATYLSNPRDTNGTNSIVSGFGVPIAPQFANELTNSVTDSFNVQVGWSIKIPGTWDKPKLQGLRGRLSFNWEGIPVHDLFGKSDGYRQPGYIMSVAPGLTYAIGRKLFIAEVPIVFNRYINARKSAVPDLNQNADGSVSAAAFNPNVNLGMVPSVAVSLRCVQSF